MSQQSFLQRHSGEVLAVAAGAAVLALAITYSRSQATSSLGVSTSSRNGSNASAARESKASKLQRLKSEYQRGLHVSAKQLTKIRDDFVDQMRATLSGASESSIRMLPSMVDVLPTGSEHGEFFALDMGGTNFRTVYVELPGGEHGGNDEVQMDEFALGDDMHHRPAEALFDFMAEKLVAFAKRIDKMPEEGSTLNVGFCFSFPMDQTAMNRGKLIKWTKGFTNSGAEGSDASLLLEEALSRQGTKARVMSLVTDTVGTLVASRYKHQDAMVGVILGTGSNGAYIEQAENIHNAPKPLPAGSEMVINCEWGNFSCDALPFLEEDEAIDAESTNAGSQHFEKLTAGMYMGEIARRIVLRLAEEADLFGGHVPDKLRTPMTLSTPQMAKIDQDGLEGLPITSGILSDAFELTQEQLTLEAMHTVQEVCHWVGWRAGRIKSVGISAVMKQLKRDSPDGSSHRTVVGVDGGVFEHYRKYRAAMTEGLRDVMGEDAADQVQFVHVADGSSLGAAYLAAAALEKESKLNEGKVDGDVAEEGAKTGPSTPDKAAGTSKIGGSVSKDNSD